MSTQVDAAAERHRLIMDRLDAIGRVEVVELAGRLDVAQETIRRDLRLLEQQGLLQRVHGGAVRRSEPPLSPFDDLPPNPPSSQVRLADLVVQALPETGTIYLGASPLTWVLAESLSRHCADGPLTVVTTSLDAAVPLSRVDWLRVYNIGGRVDHDQRGQLGDWAISELGRFRIDLAVLPAAGVTVADGLFAADPMTAAVATTEVAIAERVWLLTEADRIGVPGFVRVAPLERIERIYTAGTVEQTRLQPFVEAGFDIICVSDSSPRG